MLSFCGHFGRCGVHSCTWTSIVPSRALGRPRAGSGSQSGSGRVHLYRESCPKPVRSCAPACDRSAALPVVVESFGMLEHERRPRFRRRGARGAAFGVDLSEHRARSLGAGVLAGTRACDRLRARPRGRGGRRRAASPADRAFLLAELADVLELDVLPWPREQRRPRRAASRTRTRGVSPAAGSRGRSRTRRRLRPAVPADVRGDRPDGRDRRHAALRREWARTG